MPRNKNDDLEKVTLNINRGDKEILQQFFAQLGWSVAARLVINKFCRRLAEKENQTVKTTTESLINDNLPDLKS